MRSDRKMNNAKVIAVRLEAAGVSIKSVSECHDRFDGEVLLGNGVSVVVDTFGEYVYITSEPRDGLFHHTDKRHFDDMDGLLSDLLSLPTNA